MNLSKIKKIFRKKGIKYFNEIIYFHYIQKSKIKEKTILIEPQQGRTINGNMFYLIKELAKNDEYKQYEVYVALQKNAVEIAKKVLQYNQITSVHIVPIFSRKYFYVLATCKYLMTDTSFLPFFIKRKEQILFNTWHGTPLKCLGKKSKNDYFSIGNVQKNFLASDFLLYPNQYTKKHMLEDYMVEDLAKATILLEGYPRNTAFFDDDSRKKIREELDLAYKEVLAYMPTWREGNTREELVENQRKLLQNLKEIDCQLSNHQILYVNLHPLDKNGISFQEFKHIQEFPKQYETYQFLNVADCLITDYSSVFFDFAITHRKIILFAYDEEKYLANRGLYFDYDMLPFTKVSTVNELIHKINQTDTVDYSKFLKEFCLYENKDVCQHLCKKIILNQHTNIKEEKMSCSSKENILLYVGNLARNGISSSLKNLLSNIDTLQKNYYITFDSNKIKKNKEQLLDLPDNIRYIATTGKTNMTFLQKIKFYLYKKNVICLKWIKKDISTVYQYEIQRLYPNCSFQTVIQFSRLRIQENFII